MDQFVFNEVIVEDSVIQSLKEYNSTLDIPAPCFTYINIIDLFSKCRNLFNWFKQHNSIPVSCAVIKNVGNGHGNVHVDINPNLSNVSFNIGIQPGENSYTEIYQHISGTPETVPLPNNISFINYNNCDVKLVGKYTLETPVCLNTMLPHKIFNFGNTDRITYSFRFKKDPIELMVKKIGPEGPIYIADPFP